MIFKVEHNQYIISALRRKWRKSGEYTMRVTHSGTVCVIRKPLHRDMKTEAQLKCRARFVEAQELMLEALKDKKLRRFFQRRRLRYNYKTLRGCIRAYYIEKLIYEEEQAAKRALAEKMSVVLSEVEMNGDVVALKQGIGECQERCESTIVSDNALIRSDLISLSAFDEEALDVGDG